MAMPFVVISCVILKEKDKGRLGEQLVFASVTSARETFSKISLHVVVANIFAYSAIWLTELSIPKDVPTSSSFNM